jgi:hypothetical protein
MKTFLIITCLIISSVQLYSQRGSDYFPPVTDFLYEVYPLDSANQEIISEMFFKKDRFEEIDNYNGKLANVFLTKNAPTQDSLNNTPYLDSLFFHFDGTDGYEYFQTGSLEEFLMSIDSLNLDPNFSFLDFFRSFRDWYSLYRFTAALNDEYNLLSVDTSIVVYIPLNIRFEYIGERFPDEIINTPSHGSFNCKKFLISWNFSVEFFGNWQELLSTEDTVWIAEPGNEFWIAKDLIPSNFIDLSFFGIAPFWLLGQSTHPPVIAATEDEEFIPTEIALEQNYPNPFNPSTSIQYTISSRQFVSLKVYDIIGNEIATLVNSEKTAGTYEVEFNSHSGEVRNLPSGVYFYQLKTGSFVQTKKMILLK